ncbi:MAG TPA: aldolase/citrate lyase family protein [Kofleriaceae bacterium]|nr:aldolase/citrate lyase family protein [Kofleriaceae bacterium]
MSPQLVELYGLLGVDFVIIGSEVESLDLGRMEDMIRAADAARTVPIVKLRRPSEDLISDVLNAGAPMIMVPHVNTREQLDRMVAATRFVPEGTRGKCPIARYNGFASRSLPETHRTTNQIRAVIPILEDAEALDNLDELMSHPEVDIFEIGPFDLSSSLGDEGRGYASERTMRAIEDIVDAAQRHGKAVLAPMVFSFDKDSFYKMLEWQMNELIARGITVLYGLEVAMLSEVVGRSLALRKVRIVREEEEPARPAAARSGKARTSAGKANGARRASKPNGARRASKPNGARQASKPNGARRASKPNGARQAQRRGGARKAGPATSKRGGKARTSSRR